MKLSLLLVSLVEAKASFFRSEQKTLDFESEQFWEREMQASSKYFTLSLFPLKRNSAILTVSIIYLFSFSSKCCELPCSYSCSYSCSYPCSYSWTCLRCKYFNKKKSNTSNLIRSILSYSVGNRRDSSKSSG